MEIAVVGATAVVTLDGGHRDAAPHRDHRPRADDPARTRRPRPRSNGTTATRTPSQRRPRPRPTRPRPISDVRASERYRRAMAEVIARRAIDAALTRARGGEVPIPASGSVA